MNKKEVSELRRKLSNDSDLLTINMVSTVFVEADKTIPYHIITPYITMSDSVSPVYIETLKRVLSTSVGKHLIEYEFHNTAYEPGGAQSLLHKLLQSGLKDTVVEQAYVSHLVDNLVYSGPYALIMAHCTYTVFKKDSTDSVDEYNEELYNFIITAVCPAATGDDGFIFNSADKSFSKCINDNLIVSKIPTDGFIYPTFSDRSADVNHVMYYTKSAKDLNTSMVDSVLDCQYYMTPTVECDMFQNIISTVMGSDLNLSCIRYINDAISQIVDTNKGNTQCAVVDNHTIKHILSDYGVDSEKLQAVDVVYKKLCGNATLLATNVINHKLTINSPGVSIKVDSDKGYNLKTNVVDGRTQIIVDVYEPVLDINGFCIHQNT